MAAIGSELGVTPPALYRYFPDRAAVIDALAQDFRDQLEPPDASLPWREWLAEMARRERTLWAAHPELHEVANIRAMSRPAMQVFKVGVEVLRNAGFTPIDAMCGVSAVADLAASIGWETGQLDQLYEPDVRAEIRELKAAADVTITPETFFERSLSYILDGLAQQRQSSASGRDRRRRRDR